MPQVETSAFTVGVFQDVASAARGIDALRRKGFLPEALAILAKETPETAALIQRVFGVDGSRLEIRGLGPVVAHGPLLEALDQPDHALARLRVANTMGRIGFQPHDGFIFETLTGRGGVLVAVRSEPRAADALAVLHAYGGGNAAIGAWTGRV